MKGKILVLFLFILSLWCLYGNRVGALPNPNLLLTTNTTITNTITSNITLTNTIWNTTTITGTVSTNMTIISLTTKTSTTTIPTTVTNTTTKWDTTTIIGTMTENATNVITTTMTVISLTTHSITTTTTMTTATGTINYFEANFYSIEIEGLKDIYLNEVGKYLVFSKYNDNLTDVDDIVANLQLPNGSVFSLPVSKKETGIYEVNVNFNNLGTYVLRISGSCKGLNSENGIVIICREKGIERSDLEKLKENYTLQIAILQNEINKLKQQGNLLNQTLLVKIDNVENELRNLIKEINHNVTNRISLNEENVNKRIGDLNATILFLKEASGNQYKALDVKMGGVSENVSKSLGNIGGFLEDFGNRLSALFSEQGKKFDYILYGFFGLIGINLVMIAVLFNFTKSVVRGLREARRRGEERGTGGYTYQPPPPPTTITPPRQQEQEEIKIVESPIKNTKIKVNEVGERLEKPYHELTVGEIELIKALDEFNQGINEIREKKKELKEKGKELSSKIDAIKKEKIEEAEKLLNVAEKLEKATSNIEELGGEEK